MTASTDRVVLVHGTMDRASSFLKVARELDGVEVVTYDRRGYGKSCHLPPATGFQDHVDELFDVIGDRPAAVVGHSLGGNVALAAAIQRPGLVTAVGAYETPTPWLRWWPADSVGSRAAAAADSPADAAEAFMRGMIGDARWESLPVHTREARRAEGRAMIADLDSIRTAAPYRPEDVTAPVVLAHGEHAKPYHVRAIHWLRDRIPAAEVMVVDGAAHGGHASHPAGFARVVLRVRDRGRPCPECG